MHRTHRVVSMASISAITACLLTGLGLIGCVDGPPYVYGERITGATFAPLDETVGVHPSDRVLADPANPFLESAPVGETRWDIEASGDPVAAFYGWATLLAYEAVGENQYYAALNLQRVFDARRAAQADLETVRRLAIAGYQSVLDNFPGSVTFDASGSIPYGLATPSYRGIVELGGTPRGGWMLVTTADGAEVAIKVADPPPPVDEDDPQEVP